MTTIAERAERVIAMLANRTDIRARVEAWLRDAYYELGMSYDFEELEATHNMDVGNNESTYEYPEVSIANNNWEVRAIKALTLRGNNNNTIIDLTRKTIQWIDRYPEIYDRPVLYAPFRNSIVLHPIPSSNWTLRWRVWLKPRIEIEDNNNNLYMNSTQICLPDDWLEILDYSAALRGHIELLERDKAGEVMQLLFGADDPRTGRRIPGLIKQKMLRKHAESPIGDWGMRPKVRGYTK